MKPLSAKLPKAALEIGANHDASVLSVEDAWDVAAYINSQSRPARGDLDHDYRNRARKHVDGPFLPFNGKSPLGQHKYDRFRPTLSAQTEIRLSSIELT